MLCREAKKNPVQLCLLGFPAQSVGSGSWLLYLFYWVVCASVMLCDEVSVKPGRTAEHMEVGSWRSRDREGMETLSPACLPWASLFVSLVLACIMYVYNTPAICILDIIWNCKDEFYARPDCFLSSISHLGISGTRRGRWGNPHLYLPEVE